MTHHLFSLALAGTDVSLPFFIAEAGVYVGREFQKAVQLNGGSKERLGLGLVSFTGGWLLDSAIALQPAAIVGPPHSAFTSTSICLLYKSNAFQQALACYTSAMPFIKHWLAIPVKCLSTSIGSQMPFNKYLLAIQVEISLRTPLPLHQVFLLAIQIKLHYIWSSDQALQSVPCSGLRLATLNKQPPHSASTSSSIDLLHKSNVFQQALACYTGPMPFIKYWLAVLVQCLS